MRFQQLQLTKLLTRQAYRCKSGGFSIHFETVGSDLPFFKIIAMLPTVSQPSAISVQKAASEFVKGIISKYPMITCFRVKKCRNVWFIRAKYGDRRLYACNDTIEEAFIHFFHEINQKVILQPYKDKDTIRAERMISLS